MRLILGPKLNGALQCFSCKSLLDPSKECDEFSNRDPNQVGTCGSNEACLLYAWKKSPTETCKLIHIIWLVINFTLSKMAKSI